MDYDDGLIATTGDALLIRRYDVLLRSRRIPYSQIREVRRIALGRLRRFRIWGTAVPGEWFNLDPRRPRKRIGFVIDAGRPIRPVITPADPDGLVAALSAHNVTVGLRE
ncbi:MAG TPA: hypothetical protein VKV27_17010 [Solirubrobacteraceae bacterium]|nr:hypothetical protein [Solirubrobacteraceae bacterium]